LELLYRALSSPFGVDVETDNLTLLRSQLYAARKAANDPALEALAFCQSPLNPANLWIIKRPSDED
jgi:hypothetical protein